MIEALCNKPEGRRFDPDKVIEFLNLPNPSWCLLIL
jgi:hypothetical protein